jgi:hypothetical protein
MKEITEIFLASIRMMPEKNGEKNKYIFGEDLMTYHRLGVKV